MPESLVFIPFEYLGSAAGPQWIGRAAAAIAATQTSSLVAPAVRETISNQARYIVEGYVTGQPGALLAVAAVRDEVDQRTLRTLEARGSDVLALASALASQIVPKPKPYMSANAEAVRELFSGSPEKAIAIDPKYGTAHIALIEALLRAGKKDEAMAAIAAARSANLSEVERAQLQALIADTPAARATAFLQAARANRYDLSLWRRAAEAAMVAKDHKGAVEAYEKAVALDPENIALWNTLAYAQAFAGDVEAAKGSIAQYQKLAPKDANAYDSMGEIYFIDGRFREAEEQFLRAFEMDKSRLGGAEAYRAGIAAFVAGDRTRADADFAKYLALRKENKDELAALREAIWLYTTGRADEARKRVVLMNSPTAKSQLAVWDVVEGKSTAAFGEHPALAGWKLFSAGRYAEAAQFWKQTYDSTSLIEGNEARIMVAASLLRANREGEAKALLAKWPLPPTGPDPGFSSVVFVEAMRVKAGSR
jgi:tetratricopeptide (TPR) repeat protein